MPAQDKRCRGCAFWASGERHMGTWVPPGPSATNPAGECRIRSTPDYFPCRYSDDWCAEFKRAEEIRGYEANGHLTTG